MITTGARLLCTAFLMVGVVVRAEASFDHDYVAYAAVLRAHVEGDRVDYAALVRARSALDAVVAAFGEVESREEEGWTRSQRLAYWINAYNAFTLRSIVGHYPIRAGWLSMHPKNSIKQIDGVWSRRSWRAAGRQVSLDDIEHQILRRTLAEPMVHFAVNCASVSCPQLRLEPYRAATLAAQLDSAARQYLAAPQGLVVDGYILKLSSIFKWYGSDFETRFLPTAPPGGSAGDRTLRALVIAYGPPDAVAVATAGRSRIAFQVYDWSLNDVVTGTRP